MKNNPKPEPFELNELDAVKAAPNSHEVLIENGDVRVLKVIIEPGQKEPMHTHEWKSIMYVDKPARIKYYNEKDEMVYESPKDQPYNVPLGPEWLEPEGLHAVENIDSVIYHGIRIELKK